MVGLLAWALAHSGAAFAAECDTRYDPLDLEETLDRAETAYGRGDVGGFRDATLLAKRQIPCVSALLSRTMVSHVHRVLGLERFMDRDDVGAARAFAAARITQPAAVFPPTVARPGSREADAFTVAADPTPTTVVVAEPAEGAVFIDGLASGLRPTSRPAFYQRTDEYGRVVQSAWLDERAPTPRYQIEARRRDAGPFVLMGVSVVAAGVGTALLATATDELRKECTLVNNEWTDCSSNPVTLEARRNLRVGLGIGGLAVGVGGLIGGAVWASSDGKGATVGMTFPF